MGRPIFDDDYDHGPDWERQGDRNNVIRNSRTGPGLTPPRDTASSVTTAGPPGPSTPGPGGSSNSSYSFSSTPPPRSIFQQPNVPRPRAAFNDYGLMDRLAEEFQSQMDAPSRYTPEVMEMTKGGILQAAQGRQAAADQNVMENQVARGMYRSGQTGKRIAENQRTADASYTGGVTSMLLDKAKVDFEDKMTVLKANQSYLGQLQEFYMRQDMSELERDKLTAQISIAYANLEMQQNQLTQQWSLAQQSLSFDRYRFDQGYQNQRDLNTQANELNYMTYVTLPDGTRVRVDRRDQEMLLRYMQ